MRGVRRHMYVRRKRFHLLTPPPAFSFRRRAANLLASFQNVPRRLAGLSPLPILSRSSLPLNHAKIVDTLLAVTAKTIFEDGMFNGDPHPGNILMLKVRYARATVR